MWPSNCRLGRRERVRAAAPTGGGRGADPLGGAVTACLPGRRDTGRRRLSDGPPGRRPRHGAAWEAAAAHHGAIADRCGGASRTGEHRAGQLPDPATANPSRR